MTDKPDLHDSKKKKKARHSGMPSVFQEQFAFCEEKEHDHAKFKSLVAGLSVNSNKKKPSIVDSGKVTVQDQTIELCALYQKMNAGQN